MGCFAAAHCSYLYNESLVIAITLLHLPATSGKKQCAKGVQRRHRVQKVCKQIARPDSVQKVCKQNRPATPAFGVRMPCGVLGHVRVRKARRGWRGPVAAGVAVRRVPFRASGNSLVASPLTAVRTSIMAQWDWREPIKKSLQKKTCRGRCRGSAVKFLNPMDAVERIEVAVRACISNEMCHKYSRFQIRLPRHWQSSN